MMTRYSPLNLVLLFLLVLGCAGERPSVLVTTERAGGVQIAYEVLDKPFPTIPLPNDTATRLDDDSSTGRFINISHIGPTTMESETRTKAGEVGGFGVYMPISVPLTGPVDLVNIVKRQCTGTSVEDWEQRWARKECNDRDFSNDVALVIKLDSENPDVVPLDFGNGNFPIVLEVTDAYFDNDPRAQGQNLIFETVAEDTNDNGELDPGEDTNGDGILNVANVIPGVAEALADDPGFFAGVDDLASFFELETNTLVFRPVLPLLSKSTYAVIITKNLLDTNGKAVESPFEGIHPADQYEALKDLGSLLKQADIGMDLSDVAFAWKFTTQDTTGDMQAIRAGLYNHGPFAALSEAFPPTDVDLFQAKSELEGQAYILPASVLTPFLALVIDDLAGGGEESQNAILTDLDFIESIVMGATPGPNFLADKDGIATENYPADDDESFDVNPHTGAFFFGSTDITWWCTIPKADDDFTAPFPVFMYGHGYTSSRLEGLGFAGRLARFGYATCAIDAYGHGLSLPDDEIDLAPLIQATTIMGALEEFFDAQGYGGVPAGLSAGRARDLDNDGVPDSGGDFWTYDLFHTRDIVRQSVVDYISFIRMLRSFDGTNTWDYDTNGDGEKNLAGDFDGDGVVDFGGPTVQYTLSGASLGGILAGIVPAVEPSISVGLPIVGGGGLTDVGVRSRQGGVPEAVLMPFFGPLVLGSPNEDDSGVSLSFLVHNVTSRTKIVFHTSELIEEGDRVELENLENKHVDSAYIGADRRFRLAVPSDALSATEKRPVLGMLEDNSNVPVDVADPTKLGDRLRITVYEGNSETVKETIDQWQTDAIWQGARFLPDTTLVALANGHGKKRQTPDFRRFFYLASMLLEPGDPIAYSRHYAIDPFDFDYDPRVKDGSFDAGSNMLFIPSIGDMNVPVNTGIANARAAGAIDYWNTDTPWGMTENDVLIRNRVIEGTERTNRYQVENEEGELRSVLFDVDDLNHGSPRFGEPNLEGPPLRATKTGPELNNYVVALRLPYSDDHGSHGFDLPDPSLPFDIGTFMVNQIGYFCITNGEILSDEPCLEDNSCSFLPERIRLDPPPEE